MAASPVHTLFEPITVTETVAGGDPVTRQLTEVPMRMIRPKDLRVMDQQEGEVAKTIALVAAMTGLTVAQVDGMHPKDYKELVKATQDFS